VVLDIDSTHIPHDPEIGELMPQAVGGTADAAALARFAALWQRRIARMLEAADDPRLVLVKNWRCDNEPL